MKQLLKNIDGILLLDKPLHLSSNHALQRVKRLFGAKKAGHTGSLDPLATGMLPICFGAATKMSQFLLDSDKHYVVEGKLGIKTTTGDAEGEVVAEKPVINITTERIADVMQRFMGTITQIPPMFSALKHQGKPLYELARQGIEVTRQPRTIHIHALHLTAYQENRFNFTVHCSKGTYVRTLVEDIGDALGCGAHVIGLHRSMVAPYQQNKMYTWDELESLQQQNTLLQCLLPVATSVQHLPIVTLSSAAIFYLRTGQSVMAPQKMDVGLVKIFSEQAEFIGVGEILNDGRLVPRRLMK